MRDAGDTEKRICLIFAPRFFCVVLFFTAKNPAYWICKNKKKGAKNADNIRLKKKLIDSEWWDIYERISSDGWGNGKIGYTIWIRRPDWHGKAAFSLTGGSVKLHAACDDAFNEAKVIETLENLKELADTAWKEFPESIPVQNAFGELVEEVMVKPFAEGRDVQEG